jgi:glycine/D-amino acid oxidase-like deaminating enzyme
MEGGHFLQTADAVVIGGGLIGTSIAYRLSKRGRKVILVDRGTIASGASGACDKAVFLQSKKPGIHLELAKLSMAIYDDLEEELGIPFEFKKSGGMIAIESPQHVDFMESFVLRQQEAGISVHLLDGKEAREIQPSLSEHIVGATWSEEDAEVNPLLLCHAFATASTRFGTEVLRNTEVIGIKTKYGKISEVITNTGRIATEIVINAAGPMAPAIGQMVGQDIPIKPRRGIILISEKLPPKVRGNLLCAQYISLKHNTNAQTDDSPEMDILQYGVGLSMGQTDSGNLLIGGSREFVGFDRNIHPKMLGVISKHAARIVPFVNNIRIIRSMVGFRPYTGDGLPIICEAPDLKGFFIAAGHEGDGVALSPITGHLVANLISGESEHLHLTEKLGLNRFQETIET